MSYKYVLHLKSGEIVEAVCEDATDQVGFFHWGGDPETILALVKEKGFFPISRSGRVCRGWGSTNYPLTSIEKIDAFRVSDFNGEIYPNDDREYYENLQKELRARKEEGR